jgi:hypothetical protein
MNKELKQVLIAALNGVAASANFSAEETDKAAINALLKEIGIDENSTGREIRAKEDLAFALIEEAVDEILPKKLEGVLQEFAEVRQFARDAEVLFNIEKIGKNRAKLTISKGARGGIYRAAKLDRKYFSVDTTIQTVAVYVTLEEIILGTLSLAELYSNILEGFEEIVYKEVFNALASGRAVAGYDRIEKDGSATTVKADLGKAIDKVMPYVKQYGIPTIFGSYQALTNLANPASEFHPEMMDSAERRQYGFVQIYKGSKVVELPNYLVDNKNDTWFYDPKYVFVLPSGIKPVKVALKGDLTLIRNTSAVGSEKWEAHKLIGVGVAMANNFAVIEVSDLN